MIPRKLVREKIDELKGLRQNASTPELACIEYSIRVLASLLPENRNVGYETKDMT